ncbi:MAG: hypothetical protein DCC58_20790 [Chloroflexi bacterium]|nr:MAG: hypothetical protein DCC58_20790 [Chloroflexota bacterium]
MTALGVILLIGSLALAACGGDDDNGATATTVGQTQVAPTATTVEQSVPTDATEADTGAVEEAVDAVVLVLQQRDRDRLRDLTGDQLRQRVRDQELDQLQTCIPEGATVEVLGRQVTIDGDTATVTVTLQLTSADGKTSTSERVWTFERQADGSWMLAELPDCPFQQ